MRVSKPAENVNIILENGDGEEINSYQQDIVTPGEMLKIVLPEKSIKNDIREINVAVKKECDPHVQN